LGLSVSENHSLWAWSKTMALPVMALSLARSDGGLEDWRIGNHRSGYSSQKGPRETVLVRLFPDFQNPSFNLRPLLQYSSTPTTPSFEGTRLGLFPFLPFPASPFHPFTPSPFLNSVSKSLLLTQEVLPVLGRFIQGLLDGRQCLLIEAVHVVCLCQGIEKGGRCLYLNRPCC